MLLFLAVALSVLTVIQWRVEADAFLATLRDALDHPSKLQQLLAVVRATPRLAPLIIDIGITVVLISLFGLGGGITGAVAALAMSNTASFLIAAEARKHRRSAMAHPPGSSQSAPAQRYAPTPYVPRWVDQYNKGFFAVLRTGVNAAERATRPTTVGRHARVCQQPPRR